MSPGDLCAFAGLGTPGSPRPSSASALRWSGGRPGGSSDHGTRIIDRNARAADHSASQDPGQHNHATLPTAGDNLGCAEVCSSARKRWKPSGGAAAHRLRERYRRHTERISKVLDAVASSAPPTLRVILALVARTHGSASLGIALGNRARQRSIECAERQILATSARMTSVSLGRLPDYPARRCVSLTSTKRMPGLRSRTHSMSNWERAR